MQSRSCGENSATESSGSLATASQSTISTRKRHSPESSEAISGNSGAAAAAASTGGSAGGGSSGSASGPGGVLPTASAPKHRRIVGTTAQTTNTQGQLAPIGSKASKAPVENEQQPVPVGRELRYLTDFFPDQQAGIGRLTRSRAASRAGGSAQGGSDSRPHTPFELDSTSSAATNAVDHQGFDAIAVTAQSTEATTTARTKASARPVVRRKAPPAAHQQQSNYVDLPCSSSAAANLAANNNAFSEAQTLSEVITAASVAASASLSQAAASSSATSAPPGWHLLQPSATATISAADVARTLSAAVNSHLVDPFIANSGTNQIAVIHPPNSSSSAGAVQVSAASLGLPPGVPLALTGMLFDPLATSQAGSQHARTISRSAASQFIHGLVPRMQHLLGGHKILQQDSRVTNIVDGLRSSNELRQAEAASELAEWLLMANEDTLPAHLPVRDITHALIQLLLKEHNFELMLTSARCLTNLLEAMPRAHSIITEAVPSLLNKLLKIECIDVAEQSLCALEVLSKNNAKAILTAGGISACISHVDFFSLSSQRMAFAIASNCALYLSATEFHLVRDSLAELTERLTLDDKRCLESVCLLFYRLIENMKNYPEKLREIAGSNGRLFALVQQLLMAQHLSSTTFANLIRMLSTMTRVCPDLAATLIQLDYHTTLKNLFMGNNSDGTNGSGNGDMMERPANQLQDMVSLAAELFPRLPTSGIFEIDLVAFPSKAQTLPTVWSWCDDSGKWNAYKTHDIKMLEHKKSCGAKLVELQINQAAYTVDLDKMVQINAVTKYERAVKREISHGKLSRDDDRLILLQSDPALMEKVVSLVFPIVFIGGESSAVSLRLECMRAMLRMICPTPPSLLRVLLSSLPLSSNIASALASPLDKDISTVVAALQMVHLLLEKMSDIYGPLFRKEGVAHEIAKLAAYATETKAAATSTSDNSRITRSHRIRQAASESDAKSSKKEKADEATGSAEDGQEKEKEHIAMRTRKRSSPESSSSKKEKEPRRKSSILMNSLRMLTKNSTTSSASASGSPPSGSASPSTSNPPSANHSASIHSSAVNSFIAHMVSSGGGSSNSSTSRLPFTSSSTVSPSSGCLKTTLSTQSVEKIKVWIKKEADRILKTYLVDAGSGAVLECLEWIAGELRKRDVDVGTQPLTQLYDILKTDNVSAFEMTHSGVISALHEYLVSENEHFQPPRRLRLRRFVAIFMHLRPDNLRPSGVDGCFEVFASLISKLLSSVAQLEQFQVKVNDMGGIVTGTSGCLRGAQALRFFQNHQIKCLLRRHPDCHDLKEYHRNGGSTIKVDPFTSISAIEKYLLDKGIHRAHSNGEDSSGEEMSDDDDEARRGETAATTATTPAGQSHETRIEILIGDHALPSHMSVLQALRQYSNQLEESSLGNSLWMSTHILLYRSSTQPATTSLPQQTSSTATQTKEKRHKTSDKIWQEGELAAQPSPLWGYLDAVSESNNDGSSNQSQLSDPALPSLQLVRALYGLNRHWFALFEDENVLPTTYAPILPPSSFHSAKLSSKVTRQLSDFISVATQQIPQWTTDLVNFVPFLFPFSLRRSFIYCTSFGRDRALMHLVSQSEGAHGESSESGRLTHRLEKRKLLVKRDDLLKTSETALANNASSRVMLEVSFEGEAGTGFGPTLEFYTMVSKELQNAELKIWSSKETTTEHGDGQDKQYVTAPFGLYPQAWSHHSRKDAQRVKRFELMGRLMGQALVDSRILDLPLSPVFLHWLSAASPSHLTLSHLEQLDPYMYTSLRNLSLTEESEFEFLETYFTMPGDEAFELMRGGKNKAVTKANSLQFIKLVSHWRLYEGVYREMEAVRRGFSQVVSPSLLSIFLPDELDELFCGSSDYSEKTWSQQAITQAIKPDHGYNHESEQIKWLATMLSSFNREQQRNFVQFVTGSPRLPVGGLRALSPPLTVVKKSGGGGAHGPVDHELPSAMTCYNYLKVPAYSSYEIFCERFAVALRFIYSFHLT